MLLKPPSPLEFLLTFLGVDMDILWNCTYNCEIVGNHFREEHERIGDIIKKYGHFLKVLIIISLLLLIKTPFYFLQTGLENKTWSRQLAFRTGSSQTELALGESSFVLSLLIYVTNGMPIGKLEWNFTCQARNLLLLDTRQHFFEPCTQDLD